MIAFVLPIVLAASLGPSGSADDQSVDALLWQLGTCVVERRYEAAKSFVLSYPVIVGGESKTLPWLGKCNDILLRDNVAVSFLKSQYRYWLANALVRRDYGERGPAAIPAELALAMPHELTAPVTQRQKMMVAAFRADRLYSRVEAEEAAMGECLVRGEPEHVRQWLVTAPGSTVERTKADLLTSSYQTCAVRLKQPSTSLNLEVMRGPVALAYYRFANALSKSRT
jgi:hypothetical protein